MFLVTVIKFIINSLIPKKNLFYFIVCIGYKFKYYMEGSASIYIQQKKLLWPQLTINDKILVHNTCYLLLSMGMFKYTLFGKKIS